MKVLDEAIKGRILTDEDLTEINMIILNRAEQLEEDNNAKNSTKEKF